MNGIMELLQSVLAGGGAMRPQPPSPVMPGGQGAAPPSLPSAPDLASDPNGALMALYKDRLDEIGKRIQNRQQVSVADIRQLMSDAGIGMAQAASQPGASFGGAAGQGLAYAGQEKKARREKAKTEQERLMERAAGLHSATDERKYRRGRDAVSDARYREGIARSDRNRAEDRQFALDQMLAKSDTAMSAEMRDRVHEVAKTIVNARKTDMQVSEISYPDAYKEALAIVRNQYGGADLDALTAAVKALSDVQAKIGAQ